MLDTGGPFDQTLLVQLALPVWRISLSENVRGISRKSARHPVDAIETDSPEE